MQHLRSSIFFFFNDTATTEIYTLSLHDALPILILVRRSMRIRQDWRVEFVCGGRAEKTARRDFALLRESAEEISCAQEGVGSALDRKSTRLKSSHSQNSYGVFCFEKKKKHRLHMSDVYNSDI